jgi:ribosomal protein S18 acetylase RimI-like enzyme
MFGMETTVRTATAADLDGVVATLTDAFDDDPLMRWAHEHASDRRDRLHAMWELLAREGYLPRGASTTLPNHDGVALWLPPGAVLGDEFWEIHGERFAEGVGPGIERLILMGAAMDEHHPHDREHWYLLAIGVRCEAQGRGLGGVLLAHTLAIADERGQPAYLEATSTRSRVLYERFGFQVIGEITVGGSPPMWPMWRDPAAHRA